VKVIRLKMRVGRGRKKTAACGPGTKRHAASTANAGRLLSSPPTSTAAFAGVVSFGGGADDVADGQSHALAIAQALPDFRRGVCAFAVGKRPARRGRLARHVLRLFGLPDGRLLLGCPVLLVVQNSGQDGLARIDFLG
jgi:hypothetical protein